MLLIGFDGLRLVEQGLRYVAARASLMVQRVGILPEEPVRPGQLFLHLCEGGDRGLANRMAATPLDLSPNADQLFGDPLAGGAVRRVRVEERAKEILHQPHLTRHVERTTRG